jgi:thiamine biosynthesis lipoprotein
MSQTEAAEAFDCFGSSCEAFVIGAGRQGSSREAVEMAKRELQAWHDRFSRFLPESELSLLNEDARHAVPVSSLMARLAQAVVIAGSLTGGLVDGTLTDQIAAAGYAHDLGEPLPLGEALKLAPARRPAGARVSPGWRQIEVDLTGQTVTRPPGVRLDSGGLAKGLFADVLAERLASHPSLAINCGGDLSIGGAEGKTRPIKVESPFDGRILHTFDLQRTGVATSGIGRRSWLDASRHPAHHLLDPSTGKPAFTGVVQVTALAPSALLAEIYAKAALLSGPRAAPKWLAHGGVIVLDDGSHQIVDPPTVLTLSQLSASVQRPRTRAPENV